MTLLVFTGAAALLIAGSRGDARPRWLGGCFLTFATVFGDRFLAQLGATGPGALPALSTMLIAVRPEALGPFLLWRFARGFPSGDVDGRTRTVLDAGLTVAASLGWFLAAATFAAFLWPSAPPLDVVRLVVAARSQPNHYWTVVILLVIPALLFIVWREHLARASERRRVRLFVAGLVLGWLPQLAEVLLETAIPAYAEWASQHRSMTGMFVYPPLWSIPFVTAYAVLVERVLDVQFVIRSALQYAMVRSAAGAVLALPFVATAVYVYANRDSTISGLLAGTGLAVIAASTVAGYAAAQFAPRIFDRIDRRFFREQYDARRILGELIDRSRRVASVADLGRILSQQIDRALHVYTILLFVSDVGTRRFTAATGAARPLAADTTLLTLLAGSAEPFEVDVADSALGRLPQHEREWLEDLDARLLVPLLGSGGELVGVIVIGDKLSDLPFTPDDRRLLRDVAASAALSLQNIMFRTSPLSSAPPPVARESGFGPADLAKECTRCGSVQAVAANSCAVCEGALTDAVVPPVLYGKFQFERKLGAGGMGVVYVARDLALNRQVAVKTLHGMSPEGAARLRREARAMAAASHPNLAVIFGAETWRGTPMLIVEYLEGGTLADCIRRGPVAVNEVVRVGLLLVNGLGRLHELGLLHRDVKPSNVGFTADRTPKLLDFGLAKLFAPPEVEAAAAAVAGASVITSDITDPFRVLGTPLYLSPEAVQGLPADPSFDLWALAVLLFEAIAGRNPFKQASVSATLMAVTRGEVPDIRSIVPACPGALAEFLGGALHPDIGRRPATAAEFHARLTRAIV